MMVRLERLFNSPLQIYQKEKGVFYIYEAFYITLLCVISDKEKCLEPHTYEKRFFFYPHRLSSCVYLRVKTSKQENDRAKLAKYYQMIDESNTWSHSTQLHNVKI